MSAVSIAVLVSLLLDSRAAEHDALVCKQHCQTYNGVNELHEDADVNWQRSQSRGVASASVQLH